MEKFAAFTVIGLTTGAIYASRPQPRGDGDAQRVRLPDPKVLEA